MKYFERELFGEVKKWMGRKEVIAEMDGEKRGNSN